MSSFDRWHPFQIHSLELFIPFNCCKCTVINHKVRMFSRLFHSHKMNLLALSGFFTEQNDRFPFPFIYFNQQKPYHSNIWSVKQVSLLSLLGGFFPFRPLQGRVNLPPTPPPPSTLMTQRFMNKQLQAKVKNLMMSERYT